MKILLLNGSPRPNGNTAAALDEMEAVFAAEGLETERVQVGNRVIRGCIACGKCAELGRCVFDDLVNELAPKLEACDGLVVGSPVYYASANATLVALHPEYYYHKPDGSRGNKVGDWTDVVDLDYAVPGLWDYQIESLCYWAQYVDGFRCDVASTVPVAFWRKARQAVERVRPGAIWLGESVHLDHILAFRRQGFYAATDNELFDVFDILYPYDIWPLYEGAAGGTMPLSRYFAALSYQELSFPTWYNKLSCLENHDQRRAADRFPNRDSLLAWTALSYFQKGTTLLYAGQEVSAVHTPSLFEREPIDWTGEDLSPLLRRLYDIKKRLPTDAAFHVEADDEQGLAVADYRDGQHLAVGVFPLAGRPGTAVVPLADGGYENALTGESVTVREGRLTAAGPVIIL